MDISQKKKVESDSPACKQKKLYFLLFLIISGITAGSLVLYSTSLYGPGITYESVIYIALARDTAQGKSIITSRYTDEPPLYPFLTGLFGIDPIRIIPVFHSAVFFLIILLAGLIALKMTGAGTVSYLAVLTVMTAGPLLHISVMAWNELLFILLVLIFLLVLDSYIQRKSLILVFMLSLTAVLGFYAKYAGLTLIISGILVICMTPTGKKKKKLHSVFLFFILSTVPAILWLYRNYQISRAIFGKGYPNSHSSVDISEQAIKAFFSWFLKEKSMQNWTVYIGLYVLISTLFLMVLIYIARLASRRERFVMLRKSGHITAFILVYLVYTLLAVHGHVYSRINSRILSPVFIPLVLLGFYYAGLYKEVFQIYVPRRLACIMLITLTCLVLIPSFLIKLDNTSQRINHGAGGYSTVYWRENQALKYLQKNPPGEDAVTYSNAPEALYIIAGIKSRALSVHSDKDPEKALRELQSSWPSSRYIYLVWIKNNASGNFYSMKELSLFADIIVFEAFHDGIVYKVRRKPAVIPD